MEAPAVAQFFGCRGGQCGTAKLFTTHFGVSLGIYQISKFVFLEKQAKKEK
jgi:hypothetical protein